MLWSHKTRTCYVLSAGDALPTGPNVRSLSLRAGHLISSITEAETVIANVGIDRGLALTLIGWIIDSVVKASP